MSIPAFTLSAVLTKQIQPLPLKENQWTRKIFSLGNILRVKAIFIFHTEVPESL